MISAKAVPVLMYHHVSPSPGLVTVSPQTFAAHMGYLARAGYTCLSGQELRDFLTGAAEVPCKSVVVTFDDGYLDNYVHAFPVLQELGLHAIIFAVTGWIGDGPARAHSASGASLPACPDHSACKAAIAQGMPDSVMLRWSEIEIMEASGAVEIQSHTHSHVRWDRQFPDGEARVAALAQDLELSRDTLRHRLGRSELQLCWPWGYFEPSYQTLAAQLGFTVQYTTSPHVNTPQTPLTNIGRIVAKDRADLWLPSRLWIYARPAAARLYATVKGG
jgi:peptidoglycan/xylan/chitin deacetylase (PgdA/CDA1 family)